MNDDDLARDRALAARAQVAAGAAKATPARTATEANLGLPLLPGARVLDTISGEEGTVIGGRVEHIAL